MPSFFSSPFVTHEADTNNIINHPQVGSWLEPDGNMVQRQTGPEVTSLFRMDRDETLNILISMWIDYTEPTPAQPLTNDQVLWDISCLDISTSSGPNSNSNIAAGGFACTFASGDTDLFRAHYRQGGATELVEISSKAGDTNKSWYPGSIDQPPYNKRITTENPGWHGDSEISGRKLHGPLHRRFIATV